MPRRPYVLLAAVLMSLLIVAPAAGHETETGADWLIESGDHPGWYHPSPESQTANLSLVSSVSRTRPSSTYRNSDLAFWRNLVFAGHYDGFQIVDTFNPQRPTRLVDFPCPGSQHDVSVWNDLLFVSVETPRSSPACDSVPQSPGFEGMRIFDVSDPTAPRLITGVPTDCGSHTHTLVPDLQNRRVLLYVASYTASVIPRSAYGNECLRFDENGNRAHKKISVVEVPLRNPAASKVVSEPQIPQNDRNNVPGYTGCHDITVFMEIERAAAACMDEGQIWDISNKEQPKVIARIYNPNIEFFHSAAFSWDGKTVVFGDEAGGGTGPRCRAQDPSTLGALWFYDVDRLDVMDDSTVEPALSHWKQPRIQGDVANCTMHNFNVLTTTQRDVLVSSAYAAGTTVVDFTDPAKPRELGHWDPHGANTWSSYWYNGKIITNDGGRGVDVLQLADNIRTKRLRHSNPQTQDAIVP